MRALRLHVTGVVQGVGFRPFVYRLAVEAGLTGWVRNTSEGVFAHVEGADDAVAAFPSAVREQAPPMAVVQSVSAEDVPPEGFDVFSIESSESAPEAVTLVSPDIATCDACTAELFSPEDRRYRYPFINCTNCGPRFTIIADIPYDRPATTMRDFEMCPSCSIEYHEPADRRFHAQPDACPVCGPRLYLEPSPSGSAGPLPEQLPQAWRWEPGRRPRHRDARAERERTDALLAAAVALLTGGAILAIKGLGGFQLACDATDPAAVALLRERKRRWGKPLAVMVPDLETARRYCETGPEEEALLTGPVRPIVLLRRRPATDAPLAEGVAGDLPELGVMLPYTPLHHLLIAGADRPLVMTSGNLSEEPIAMGDAEALERLAPIADAFLLHDRAIRSRYDDSVARVVLGEVAMVRRARGYAPFPLPMPVPARTPLLAVGPEQKNTFCLVKPDGDHAHAFVSQHIGDMENAETLQSFEDTLALYERLFRVSPEAVAYDLHPEYLSTKLALGMELPGIGVQHHHAHVASVTGEHGVSGRIAGLAYDGTGYGADGTIWGGEVLLADWEGFERFAHLRQVPMPGGAAAIRRPARMAVGLLAGLDPALLEHRGAAPLLGRLADGELQTLLRMIERGVNSPLTSSMGRLFDAVAALAGVLDDAAYEGQAAIELEAAMDRSSAGAYAFGIESRGGGTVIDPLPVIEAMLGDIAVGTDPGTVSARFHRAVADASVRVARAATEVCGRPEVALAGGVFMNRYLAENVPRMLSEAHLRPLTHRDLPFNDGAVSFGQAVVASSRLHKI